MRKTTLFEKVTTSKSAMILLVVVVVVVVAGGLDTALNWNKAFGNVTVNGVAVGGMTSEEMLGALKDEFGMRVSHTQVTIYADEEARSRAGQSLTEEERRAIAEQVSPEEAVSSIGSWTVDVLSLKGVVPYERAVEEALSLGREEGGLPARIGLLFAQHDVDLAVQFDDTALEELASDIDRTIGDPRVDTTVVVEEGVARAVEGHDGTMIDRGWLADEVSKAMLDMGAPNAFVAQAVSARSRITLDQARETADAINRAIGPGALFVYQGRSWLAQPALLGDWTSVEVVEGDGTWKLEVGIDSSSAIPAVVQGAGAAITSDDMTVTFEDAGAGIAVHTAGSGNIPEVAPAISSLEDALYGASGTAWGAGDADAVEIEIGESDRPETMTFDEALDLGVITVIGEYTTEFSSQEGTENRNHNIKLAADILNDAIIDADGGLWNFNERSGDTNEAAGFWSAGSIIDGEYVDSIGGGICQVATTIFNAVYEAGLDVVERHNHTLYIASYPTGRDAAVSYPELDFIWQNNLESDILLKLDYTDTTITAQLYSVFTGYTTTTTTGEWKDGEEYGTRFEQDDSLGSGSYYLKTTGADGSKITIERTVKDAVGKLVKSDSFYSEYEPKDEVYVVGPDVNTSKLMHKGTKRGSSGDADVEENDDGDVAWY